METPSNPIMRVNRILPPISYGILAFTIRNSRFLVKANACNILIRLIIKISPTFDIVYHGFVFIFYKSEYDFSV